jgi:hypothetical protein
VAVSPDPRGDSQEDPPTQADIAQPLEWLVEVLQSVLGYQRRLAEVADADLRAVVERQLSTEKENAARLVALLRDRDPGLAKHLATHLGAHQPASSSTEPTPAHEPSLAAETPSQLEPEPEPEPEERPAPAPPPPAPAPVNIPAALPKDAPLSVDLRAFKIRG